MAKKNDSRSKGSKKQSASNARNRQRTEQEIIRARREARHRRRVRSTVLCWMLLVILIILAAVGVMFAGHKISDLVVKKNQEKAEKIRQTQEKEEESSDKGEDKKDDDSDDADEPEEYTEEDLLNDMIDTCINEMGLEERVAGLILATPEDLTGVDQVLQAGDSTEAALSTIPVGGIVYHSANVQNENQFSTMLVDTIDRSKYPLFLVLNEDNDALNSDALTEYGINFDLGKKEESGKTVKGLPMPSDDSVGAIKVLILDGSSENAAEDMKKALSDGVDMFYITKGINDAYGKFLDVVKSDDELKDQIDKALENVYRIKYSGRLSEN